MDTGDMRERLRGYLDELDWSGFATKEQILGRLAGRDDTLRTVVAEYVADGRYPSDDAVLNVIPEQAWQDAQGGTWHGSASPLAENAPTSYGIAAAGRDNRPAGDAAD